MGIEFDKVGADDIWMSVGGCYVIRREYDGALAAYWINWDTRRIALVHRIPIYPNKRAALRELRRQVDFSSREGA